MKPISNCLVCDSPLLGKQRSFCSVRCKNEHFLSYATLKVRANERKKLLIDKFGGNCSRCGYSTSLDALTFYDGNGESLRLNINTLANSNYGKLEERVRGALLLCKNCAEESKNTEEVCHVTDAPSAKGLTGSIDTNFEKKFEENLIHCGVKQGQTIVLGVSGGVDSVTMLNLFSRSKLKLKLIVAHMNHGVRETAKNDETFVKELAEKYGYKFVSKTIIKPTVGNLEENLRNERRKFLLSVVNNNGGLQGGTLLALAHNANDQAETFIMNAVRGSSPAGLGAMNMSDEMIIRPLLNFSRAEIEHYAKQNGLLWHEDETNKDISLSRNFVRYRVLPLFEQLNPTYLSAIHRTTHLQRQIDRHLKEEAYRVITNYQIPKDKQIRNSKFKIQNYELSAARLRRLDKPLLYEVLGLLYEEAKGNRQNLSLDHLSKIESLIKNDAGTKTLDLPEKVTARRRYDKLDFYQKKAHNIPSVPRTIKLRLGTQRFGEWEIVVKNPTLNSPEQSERSRTRILDSSVQPQNDDLVISADMLHHLSIRTRKPGDSIASIGLNGTKKLQDLFVDAKIDRVARDTWPILIDERDNKIIWIPYLAKTQMDIKNRKVLTINIERWNI
jgi:tRNA(Ile)-lysidine synthase